MKNKIFIVALVALLPLLLFSCSKKLEEQGDSTLSLRVALPSIETMNFHPTTALYSYEKLVTSLIYEPLVKVNNGAFVCVLAERYEVPDHGKSVIFHLRPDVKWQNGTSFTAGDVLFTLLKSFTEGQIYTEFPADAIIGLEDYKNGKAEEVSGIQIQNDLTIEVFSPYGSAYVLNEIGTRILMFSKSASSELAEETGAAEYQPHFVGTGAFAFANYSQGSHIQLAANTDYWGEKPLSQRIVFKSIGNEDWYYLMETGSINVSVKGILSETDKEKLQHIGARTIFTGQKHQVSLALHTEKMHLNNRDFRKALMLSIDRNLFEGQSNCNTSTGILCTDMCETTVSTPFRQDIRAAEELLFSLGYEKQNEILFDDTGKPVKLTLIYTVENEFIRLYAPIIKQNFAEIGIDLQTILLTEKEFQIRLKNGDYEIALIKLPALSIYRIGDLFLSSNRDTTNYTHYINPDIDMLLGQINPNRDNPAVCAQACALLAEDIPFIPLLVYEDILVASKQSQHLLG